MTTYPHFIPDKPLGKDCFDGHSQENLAHSICNYVRMTDAKPEGKTKADQLTKATMPRIIGLEGEWGAGKSNVVSMIGKGLKGEGYYTFTYDAWGHQEDLQRRSILETMTSLLIKDEVLQGDVEIRMRNGKPNNASWNDQLALLLSNKTTTIRKSTPKLTGAAFWGIGIVTLFAVCSLVAEQLITNACDFQCYWWIDFIPIAVALLIGFCYRIKDGSWENIFRMVDYTNNDTIDEEFTSSEEPSVAEFKNWMRAISDYLGGNRKAKFKKLVIVFDNMDRLPSEKVMQLWSSIYSFFAGGEFENIWVVIPYDYKHLCEAIGDGNDVGERIKQFISKTFPISFHVPQPVITDYKKLFYTYFDNAFGKVEHDREHICQVFMHLRPQANPRTVIRFMNELVALRLRWYDAKKFRLQNLALYALKKDYIHYEGESLDSQLLSDGLFDEIGAFYPEQEKVRTELCQYAYGLEDEKLAGELPLRNELKRLVEAGEKVTEYAGRENFLSVLEDVLNDVDQASIDNAVKSLASLDGAELSEDGKRRIQSKWDFLANKKLASRYDKHEYDETLTVLINHATEKRINEMAKAFAKAMQGVKVTDGAAYFHAQDKLQQAMKMKKVAYDDSEWYVALTCTAEQFVQYVCEAKDEYKHYGLTCETKELNEYLLNGAKSGNGMVPTVIDYIRDNEEYDLSELIVGLTESIEKDEISDGIPTVAYVHRVLDKEDGVLKVRFKKETVVGFLSGNQAPWADKKPAGLEDVIAMQLADGKDLGEIDEDMLPRVSGCMGRYMDYTELMKHTGKEGSAYRKLNVYCIEHRVGGRLELVYAARHLYELHAALGTDINVTMKHFNGWPAVNWGELTADCEYVQNVKNYVQQSLFMAYKNNTGKFADSIIELGITALGFQNSGFLAMQKSQNGRVMLVINDYWKEFVETYLGTKYLPGAGELLTGEAVAMLQWMYDRGEVREPQLLDDILEHADEGILRSYLHGMMNDHLSKTDISKEKFLYFGKMLPMLGADMDANTARGLITHFIKPVYKDDDCAAVIVKYKDFYLAVMRQDAVMAAGITKEMIEMETCSEIAEELVKLFEDEKD